MMTCIKSKKSMLIVCTIIIGTSLVAVGLPVATLGQESTRQAHVIFRTPLSVEEAIREAEALHLSPILLEHEFTLGQAVAIGFIGVGNVASPVITQQAPDLHQAFLRDMAASTQRQIAQGTLLSRQMKNSLQARARDIDAAMVSPQSIRITRMTVEGTARDIQATSQQQSNIQEYQLQSSQSAVDQVVKVVRHLFAVTRALAAVSFETWVPEYGWSDVGVSSSTSRFTNQSMYWDSVTGFPANSTYEHDFFLNNYDGKTYLDSAETSGSYPKFQYASSDLPRAYLDTRFADNRNELAYTIGSADAKAIQKNRWYYTYIRTANGNVTIDGGKLQAQLGHRSPSYCYSTWCSFGDQIERIIAAWQVPVPGSKYWTK